jgi:phosphoribosylamine--glycine ligase
MNVLLIGSGGREHALAWKLAQSPMLDRLFAAPGNPGIADEAELVTLDPSDHASVIRFCRDSDVELVVVGPEAPLVDGLGDALRASGILAFGPNRIPAQLEGSKGFTKDLCAREGIPTAGYVRAGDRTKALAALERFGLPVVIKADGLAAGKGVIIAEDRREAEKAIESMFAGSFGSAGAEVVIEEFLTGEEASFFALTDGRTIVPFGSAQDHKRVGDGDTGPNTGGMGAYTPVPWFGSDALERAAAEVFEPIAWRMARDAIGYRGVLYAGLMLTEDGPQALEFNCRFGDPETQVILPLLETPLDQVLLACIAGRLDQVELRWRSGACAAVVLAAPGYPGAYPKGLPIYGLNEVAVEYTPDELVVFHAGTAGPPKQPVTSGGRVLAVSGLGDSLSGALARAYAGVERIHFEGMHYRRDIGAVSEIRD